MLIKCGHREFNVCDKDKILDNGVIYQLVTQKYRDGFYHNTPVVSKKQFNQLMKNGYLELIEERDGLKTYSFKVMEDD